MPVLAAAIATWLDSEGAAGAAAGLALNAGRVAFLARSGRPQPPLPLARKSCETGPPIRLILFLGTHFKVAVIKTPSKQRRLEIVLLILGELGQFPVSGHDFPPQKYAQCSSAPRWHAR